MIGTTVSHYDILERLGSDGMGVVHEARNPDPGRLVALRPTPRPAHVILSNLGTLHFHAGNASKAVATYEKALAIDDHNYVLWGNLATASHALTVEAEKARAACARATTLAEEPRRVDPSDSQHLIDLAGYCGRLEEQQEGVTSLDTVVKTKLAEPELVTCIVESCETWASTQERLSGSAKPRERKLAGNDRAQP